MNLKCNMEDYTNIDFNIITYNDFLGYESPVLFVNSERNDVICQTYFYKGQTLCFNCITHLVHLKNNNFSICYILINFFSK